MKKSFVLFFIVLISGFPGLACASDGYDIQKGTTIGVIDGALVGQAIGHNARDTSIGVVDRNGPLAGIVAGNAIDQSQTYIRLTQASRPADPFLSAGPGDNPVEFARLLTVILLIS